VLQLAAGSPLGARNTPWLPSLECWNGALRRRSKLSRPYSVAYKSDADRYSPPACFSSITASTAPLPTDGTAPPAAVTGSRIVGSMLTWCENSHRR
jgi:hypothetical protein